MNYKEHLCFSCPTIAHVRFKLKLLVFNFSITLLIVVALIIILELSHVELEFYLLFLFYFFTILHVFKDVNYLDSLIMWMRRKLILFARHFVQYKHRKSWPCDQNIIFEILQNKSFTRMIRTQLLMKFKLISLKLDQSMFTIPLYLF